MHPLPKIGEKTAPPEPVFAFAAGLAFRTIKLDRGQIAGQHSHDYAHATLIVGGPVRGWKGNEWIGDKSDGQAFEVEAGVEHCYQALGDAFITCVHDEASANSLKRKGL